MLLNHQTCKLAFTVQISALVGALSYGRGIAPVKKETNVVNLTGQWRFQINAAGKVIDDKWYLQPLNDDVLLPGAMVQNNKVDNITLKTTVYPVS